MKRSELLEKLERFPVITAVKNEKELGEALQTESELIFVLFGDLQTLKGFVKSIQDAGKLAIIHIDLVDGLSPKETAVEFLSKTIGADGIISTKFPLLKKAKALGLITVQRFFLLDSLSLKKIHQQEDYRFIDLVEILPGCMPKIIKKVCNTVLVPVIAGGLIEEKEDVLLALKAGAAAVSSTNPDVWRLV